MAYTQPSVTVRQVQKTASFPLPDPELESCIVGPGFYFQDPSREDDEMNSVISADYVGDQMVISGASVFPFSDFIADTVIVDLVRKSGTGGTIGSTKHLVKDTDFTVSGAVITINADIAGYTAAGNTAKVRVGFLSKKAALANKYEKVSSAEDIEQTIGAIKFFNPLAYGASVAMANSGSSTNILGVDPSTGPAAQTFTTAVSILETKPRVYSIAPLTNLAAQIAVINSHVTAASEPDQKMERIAFSSARVTTYPVGEFPSSSEKLTVAEGLQAYATGINNKRAFVIHPDAGWVEDFVHISTIKQSFYQAVFGDTFTLYPLFASNVTVGTTTYKAFSEITESIRLNLVANGISYLTVLAPVPGYYFAAALAGRAIGKAPAQPLTNTSISGFSKVYRSNDYFNISQLNTMAEGGTWLLEEKAPNVVVNRHQMSTAASTVQTRELSITTAIDYSAKYLRDLVSPLIGRFNIDDNLIKNIKNAAEGAATNLVNDGVLRSMTVAKVYQDELNPDTIKIDIELVPLYPVNQIKITLTF